MKTLTRIALISFAMGGAVYSQQPIRLRSGVLDTSRRRAVPESESAGRRRHWLLQFDSYPGPSLVAELQARGIRVLQYIPDSVLVVSGFGPLDLRGLHVAWAGLLHAAEKLSPLLRSGRFNDFIVSLHPDGDRNNAMESIREAGLEVVENTALQADHILVSGPPDRLAAAAADDNIAYIFPADGFLRYIRRVYRCPGPLTVAGPAADYSLEGPGWPRDANGGYSLSYFFEVLPSALNPGLVRSEIERAMAEWERYSNVIFTPAGQAHAARSIDILFAARSHGDDYPFTSPASLSHTFFPNPPNPETIAGDVHMNIEANWQIGTAVDVFSAALHELGHALGLAHSDNPAAVMYPYYKTVSGLSNDDIAAIQALYGAPSSVSPPPVVSTPPPPVPQPPPAPPATGSPSSGSDTVPPSIKITSPGGSIVSAYSDAITITGTAADNAGLVAVRWTSSTGLSGTATGTVEWTATVPLLVGDNVVTLRAYDTAGNSAWRAITVVRH